MTDHRTSLIPCAWGDCRAESTHVVVRLGQPSRALSACHGHTGAVHDALDKTDAGTRLVSVPSTTKADEGRRVLVGLDDLTVLPDGQPAALAHSPLIRHMHSIHTLHQTGSDS